MAAPSYHGEHADRRRRNPLSRRNPVSALEPVGSQALRRLASLVALHTPSDGVFELRVPGLYAVRRSRVTTG